MGCYIPGTLNRMLQKLNFYLASHPEMKAKDAAAIVVAEFSALDHEYALVEIRLGGEANFIHQSPTLMGKIRSIAILAAIKASPAKQPKIRRVQWLPGLV